MVKKSANPLSKAERYKIWAEANPEHNKARHEAFYAANGERIRAKRRARYAEKREEEKAAQAAYRAANPEKIKATNAKSRTKHREKRNAASRENYAANKATIAARHAAYLREHPEVVSAYNRSRKARLRGAKICDFTAQQWEDMLQIYEHRCVYDGEIHEHLTQDHIIPLAHGGDHTWSNIVPACVHCNTSKRHGPPPPFVIEPITCTMLPATEEDEQLPLF